MILDLFLQMVTKSVPVWAKIGDFGEGYSNK